MAKKKKKERKNNKMPPLHWVDKLIYWVTIAVLVGILVFLSLFPFLGTDNIIFRGDHFVIAIQENTSLWWLPACFMLLIITAMLGGAYTSRYPIFGIPNFIYGPSKYPRIYPLFSKDKPKKKHMPFWFWLIEITLVLALLATYPLCIYGGKRLHQDGSIHKYNALNKEIAEYHTEEITHVEIFVQKYTTSSHRNKLSFLFPHYRIAMSLTTVDGKTQTFSSNEFRGSNRTEWLHQMLQIKQCYPSDIITYDTTYMDELWDDKEFSEEEIKQIHQLFDLEN